MTVAPGLVAEDSRARRAAVEDLGRNLFVEAGAGTGKTTALVGRILQLVRSGVSLTNVAAITFTEKAAAELRERLRSEIVACAREPVEPAESELLATALADLDGAAACTLHSFAQRILREHATEAGLPPRLEMLDEIGADMDFADSWERFVEEVLQESQMERAFVLADALGMRMSTLRKAAGHLVDNWDLAADRIPPLSDVPEVPPLEYADLQSEMRALADVPRQHLLPVLGDRLDGLADVLWQLDEQADQLDDAEELDALEVLAAVAGGGKPPGNKANWRPGFNKDEVRARLRELREAADQRLARLGASSAARLLARLAEFTLAEVERRRRSGRLIFHDLLVQTRNLLHHPETGGDVRRALHRRYRHLLIDEFQDTDPIQVDLALLIATDPDSEEPDTSDALGRRGLGAGEGRLFFVGDPKQSLYRFRRADIGTYLDVAASAGVGARETLSRNWRSSPEIVDWVNAIFGRLIRPEAGSQPSYVPLVAGREPSEPEARLPVLLLGADADEGRAISAEHLRDREFADVARLARRAVDEAWPVAGSRPIRLSDICVLIPARTVLTSLINAFDLVGVPYRVESSALVYGTRAETDLLAVLRAVDDPSDHLAVVTALRSAAFGFGDDELYAYRRACSAAQVAWGYLSHQPEHPIAEALAWLAELHEARLWTGPGEIVDRVVRDRRLMELAFAERRHRDVWRRLRRAVDQARAFSDSTGGTLREYLRWVDMQRGEGARVVEALVPETDDDAVRVMTVHAAKGLEFPFVVVAGFSGTTAPRRGARSGELIFPSDGDSMCRLAGRVQSPGFDAAKTMEEMREFHEDLRKLYVACTRARDYLAVSLYRTGRYPGSWKEAAPMDDSGELVLKIMTLAEALANTVAAAAAPQPPGQPDIPHPLMLADSEETLTAALQRAEWRAGRPAKTLPPRPPAATTPETTAEILAAPLPTPEEWKQQHHDLIEAAKRPHMTSAGRLAAELAASGSTPAAPGSPDPGLAKDVPDAEASIGRGGRYGEPFGKAVHAVLQGADLRALPAQAAVDSSARRHAAAEGVEHRAAEVEQRVRAALASRSVRQAAKSRHWREIYVGAEVDGRFLEGFIDLLYEAPDGSFVVVDYKTHAAEEPPALAQKPAYRLQIAAYALMLQEATGRTVSRCVFVFLGPNGAHEVQVDDLPQAITEVRRAIA